MPPFSFAKAEYSHEWHFFRYAPQQASHVFSWWFIYCPVFIIYADYWERRLQARIAVRRTGHWRHGRLHFIDAATSFSRRHYAPNISPPFTFATFLPPPLALSFFRFEAISHEVSRAENISATSAPRHFLSVTRQPMPPRGHRIAAISYASYFSPLRFLHMLRAPPSVFSMIIYFRDLPSRIPTLSTLLNRASLPYFLPSLPRATDFALISYFAFRPA